MMVGLIWSVAVHMATADADFVMSNFVMFWVGSEIEMCQLQRLSLRTLNSRNFKVWPLLLLLNVFFIHE